MTVPWPRQVTRRIFGLPRTVWAVRCPDCGWHRETRSPVDADELRRGHVCEGAA